MSLDALYRFIEHRDRKVFHVYACGDKPPGESDLAAFESDYDVRLPEDFREFSKSPLGGLY